MTIEPDTTPSRPRSVGRTIGRVLLGLFLVGAGVGHLTIAREGFQAQVPPWLPFDVDFVVVASGIVEITLGLALLLLTRYRIAVGWVVALFFLAIFPGNISQLFVHTATAGWDNATAIALGVRLLFQPLLVTWALWSTGAFTWWRGRRS